MSDLLERERLSGRSYTIETYAPGGVERPYRCWLDGRDARDTEGWGETLEEAVARAVAKAARLRKEESHA